MLVKYLLNKQRRLFQQEYYNLINLFSFESQVEIIELIHLKNILAEQAIQIYEKINLIVNRVKGE